MAHYEYKLWQMDEALRRLRSTPALSVEKQIQLAEYLSQLSGYLIGVQQAMLYLGHGIECRHEMFALEDKVGIDLHSYDIGRAGEECRHACHEAWEKWLWETAEETPALRDGTA